MHSWVATSVCMPALQLLYKSTGFVDELAWAAAWLYKATNTASYLADAKKYYSQVSDLPAALALLCFMHSASAVSSPSPRARVHTVMPLAVCLLLRRSRSPVTASRPARRGRASMS